eukprot:3196714-Amphidinium_carterae.3
MRCVRRNFAPNLTGPPSVPQVGSSPQAALSLTCRVGSLVSIVCPDYRKSMFVRQTSGLSGACGSNRWIERAAYDYTAANRVASSLSWLHRPSLGLSKLKHCFRRGMKVVRVYALGIFASVEFTFQALSYLSAHRRISGDRCRRAPHDAHLGVRARHLEVSCPALIAAPELRTWRSKRYNTPTRLKSLFGSANLERCQRRVLVECWIPFIGRPLKTLAVMALNRQAH